MAGAPVSANTHRFCAWTCGAPVCVWVGEVDPDDPCLVVIEDRPWHAECVAATFAQMERAISRLSTARPAQLFDTEVLPGRVPCPEPDCGLVTVAGGPMAANRKAWGH